jgi:hypothetical protein
MMACGFGGEVSNPGCNPEGVGERCSFHNSRRYRLSQTVEGSFDFPPRSPASVDSVGN